MNQATQTKTTMRELLARWAEVEPDRCEKAGKKPMFTIRVNEDEKNILDSDDLSALDLAWIQWAVQQAIVARGWPLELEWHREWEAWVDSEWASSSLSSSAAALLGAYLKALEATK